MTITLFFLTGSQKGNSPSALLTSTVASYSLPTCSFFALYHQQMDTSDSDSDIITLDGPTGYADNDVNAMILATAREHPDSA
jgi:hypothetical protein